MAAWSFTVSRFNHDSLYPGADKDAVLEAVVTTGSDVYATGGMVLASLASYFASIRHAQIVLYDPVANVERWSVGWDGGTPAAGKLLVFTEDQASGVVAQVADMTDLSVTPGTLHVLFRGVKLATYGAAARPLTTSGTGGTGVA